MTFYEILLELAKEHVKFCGGGYADMLFFYLNEKTVSNGNIVLMENGEIIPQTIKLKDGRTFELTKDMELMKDTSENVIQHIEQLYEEYKTSVTNRNGNNLKSNFYACQEKELTVYQLTNNPNRTIAKYALEGYVLCSSIQKQIPWENDLHWFWQSKKDNCLILYKSWL